MEVIIVGASGHGKVIADIIEKSGDSIVGYLDDDTSLGKDFNSYPILGTVSDYIAYKDCSYIIAIGDSEIRKRISEKMADVKWYNAIHPDAVVAKNVSIGEGTVIMAGVIVNPGTTIGVHCIINSSAVVEHDNTIGDYSHISVGAKLAGTVHIGKSTWVGIGAVVSNNINICDNVIIGAGGVVINNIEEQGTYVGVPVRRISAMKETNINNYQGGVFGKPIIIECNAYLKERCAA